MDMIFPHLTDVEPPNAPDIDGKRGTQPDPFHTTVPTHMRSRDIPTSLATTKAALFAAPPAFARQKNGVPMAKVVWHET
jgi:hypothetical protein